MGFGFFWVGYLVWKCYRASKLMNSARKDLPAQHLALNLDVAAKIEKGSPVTAPGVPKNYPDAKKLVTEDCIQPAEAVKLARPV